ncbi:hypothetical protein BO94DRAFT_520476 [Aspergillus sclerotioniger CBS 115572]|uniref:N-acetyltransferase domain-containing protein n=1 Tax=Aspergillus sclerotioniger CBS 115572 TaxID=1450535 RepID=A0A317W6H6_9EURO|nr:hypothetical protein BO94DRAFT_520476 [Aspergillus sclerotioniger CBS 115572]PWY81699.1 hypothetical protein BO94DRAFT_520476 [Aspergillus sclerotioniger CBS 115572]
MQILIQPDPLTHPSTISLLTLHHTSLQSKPLPSTSSSNRTNPPSCYVLPLTTLQTDPTITVFTAWNPTTNELLGCGALKELSPTEAELKSMRTVTAHLRKGVARAIAEHILDVAKQRGYKWVGLGTGGDESFEGARRLYHSLGFRACEPFGEYVEWAGGWVGGGGLWGWSCEIDFGDLSGGG